MLTPIEISKKAFRTVMTGGYHRKDVDEFLHEVKDDYETLYRDVLDLKEKNARLNAEFERYSSTGDQLQKALTMAQKTADEIKLSAERQADLTIMQSNIRSQQILQTAEEKLKNLSEMYRQFSSEFASYLETFSKLLHKLDHDSSRIETQVYGAIPDSSTINNECSQKFTSED
jgi:cell division initiation protein